MYGLGFAAGLLFCSHVLLVVVSGDPQLFYFPASYYPPQYLPPVEPSYQPSEHFRGGAVPSYQNEKQPAELESRLFFNAINSNRPTITYSTTTSTSTVTVTTYCTTSGGALATCSPAGRRRRGLASSSIYYNDANLEDIAHNPWTIES